jgi:hypothetical protein
MWQNPSGADGEGPSMHIHDPEVNRVEQQEIPIPCSERARQCFEEKLSVRLLTSAHSQI